VEQWEATTHEHEVAGQLPHKPHAHDAKADNTRPKVAAAPLDCDAEVEYSAADDDADDDAASFAAVDDTSVVADADVAEESTIEDEQCSNHDTLANAAR